MCFHEPHIHGWRLSLYSAWRASLMKPRLASNSFTSKGPGCRLLSNWNGWEEAQTHTDPMNLNGAFWCIFILFKHQLALYYVLQKAEHNTAEWTWTVFFFLLGAAYTCTHVHSHTHTHTHTYFYIHQLVNANVSLASYHIAATQCIKACRQGSCCSDQTKLRNKVI